MNTMKTITSDSTEASLQELLKSVPQKVNMLRVSPMPKGRMKYVTKKDFPVYWNGVEASVEIGIATMRKNDRTRVDKFEPVEWNGKAVAKKPVTKKPATKKAAKKKPAANGKKKSTSTRVNKSSVKNPCELVWDICDKNKDKKRKEILAACQDAGVAFYTARTQYQLWRSAGKTTG